MKAVFSKFGKDLGCDISIKDGKTKRVSLFKPENFKKRSIVNRNNTLLDPFKNLDKV